MYLYVHNSKKKKIRICLQLESQLRIFFGSENKLLIELIQDEEPKRWASIYSKFQRVREGRTPNSEKAFFGFSHLIRDHFGLSKTVGNLNIGKIKQNIVTLLDRHVSFHVSCELVRT